MPRLAIPVTAVTLALAAAACASAPAASVDPATPAAAMGLARDHLVALRAAEARVHARVDAIRDVVRRKDPIAPWRELVCLEERVPAITAFANRGERAYTAFHAALDRGDAEGASVRLASLDLARRGVERQMAIARACGSPTGDGTARVPNVAVPDRLVSLSGALPAADLRARPVVIERTVTAAPSGIPAVDPRTSASGAAAPAY
ncbi:MAG: hypothetical protein H6745_19555 [Deltaproteobacteria bacterium]|nr:hypothetical protein [Deltaproteobacteria bacterium]